MYCSVYLGYRTRRITVYASPLLSSRPSPSRVPAYDFVRRDPDQRANFRPGMRIGTYGVCGGCLEIREYEVRACVYIYIYIVGPGGINVKIYRQILIGKSSCVSMGYGIK